MKNFSINDKIDERLAVSLLNEDWYHEYSLFGPNEYYNDQEERIKSNYLFLVGTVQDIFSLPDCNLKLSLSYNYTLPLKKDGSLIKHLQHITFLYMNIRMKAMILMFMNSILYKQSISK